MTDSRLYGSISKEEWYKSCKAFVTVSFIAYISLFCIIPLNNIKRNKK